MGLAIFVGLMVAALAPAFVARSKGRSFWLWFFYGLVIPLFIPLIHALLIKRDQRALDRRRMKKMGGRKCPSCAEVVRKDARVCRYCGRDIEPALA